MAINKISKKYKNGNELSIEQDDEFKGSIMFCRNGVYKSLCLSEVFSLIYKY